MQGIKSDVKVTQSELTGAWDKILARIKQACWFLSGTDVVRRLYCNKELPSGLLDM